MKTLIILFTFLSFFTWSQDTTSIEKEIFNKITTYRSKKNLNKLLYNCDMVKSCREYSYFMGKNDNLVHVKDIMSVNASAEIIQQTYIDEQTHSELATSVLNNFLSSPSHKKIIESKYIKISVGVFIGKDESIWVTIRFF